jgi:2Fe-2S ferredoxin
LRIRKYPKDIETGTSILDAALDNNIEIPHNCGGYCACSTCHVYIKSGMENLLDMNSEEADMLDIAYGLTLESRLACQAIIMGDVTVEIPPIPES